MGTTTSEDRAREQANHIVQLPKAQVVEMLTALLTERVDTKEAMNEANEYIQASTEGPLDYLDELNERLDRSASFRQLWKRKDGC